MFTLKTTLMLGALLGAAVFYGNAYAYINQHTQSYQYGFKQIFLVIFAIVGVFLIARVGEFIAPEEVPSPLMAMIPKAGWQAAASVILIILVIQLSIFPSIIIASLATKNPTTLSSYLPLAGLFSGLIIGAILHWIYSNNISSILDILGIYGGPTGFFGALGAALSNILPRQ